MANVPDDRPFEALELAALFRPLETSRGLVIAVSGGSDSTALLYLLARWRSVGPVALPVLAVTIDHGLRPEAANEARAVAARAASLGLAHRTLLWQGEKPSSNLQDAARTARYGLLAEAARDFGADAIVTAHTEDDQAETFLLALQRGSGVYGLAAMRPARAFGDLTIFRPLLTVSRARLRAMLTAEGIGWFEDPSNDNARFARVKLRQNRAALGGLGLTITGLAETATRMARAADALEATVDRLIARSSAVSLGGIVRVEVAKLIDEPAEIRLRAMARLLAALSGAPYVPRFDRLERFLDAVETAFRAGKSLQRTLSGVTARFEAGQLVLFREAGRMGFPSVVVGPGETIDWDRRVRLMLSPTSPHLRVRALGPGARSRVRVPEARGIPAVALQTLPALVTETGDIVAVIGLQAAADGASFEFGSATSLVAARLLRPAVADDPDAETPERDCDTKA